MFDIESHLDKLLTSNDKPVLYFSEAGTGKMARMFFAAAKASEFANIVLVGSKDEISAKAFSSPNCSIYAKAYGLSDKAFIDMVLQKVIIVNPNDPAYDARRRIFAQFCYDKLSSKSPEPYEYYYNWLKEPVPFSILSTANIPGYGRDGHCVLGGLTTSSRDFFLPCLKLHPRNGTVFLAAIFALPDFCNSDLHKNGVVVIADVAVVSEMDSNKLADITLGTAEMAHDLLSPSPFPEINVGILSYSTRGSGVGTSVDMIRNAYDLAIKRIACSSNGKYDNVNITPELQFAPAILERAAKQKMDISAPINRAAGKANVLIAPNLDVGNILFHLHVAYFKGSSPVLIPIGFAENSAVDFSRSSKVKDIALAAAAITVRIQKMENYNPNTNLIANGVTK